MDCELERVFRKYLGTASAGSILEVGCGSSRWLPYFAKELGLHVFGIDYSPTGIANARANLQRGGVEAGLVEGDLFRQAEIGSPRTDAVFSLGFLEHFADPEIPLAAMCRFLNPGGIVVSLMPNVPGLILGLSSRLNPGLASSYCALDAEGWREVHRRCGLEVLEAYYAQFLDLTWLNLRRLSPGSQVWLSRLFRLTALPSVWLGMFVGAFVRSRRLGASIIVVARRSDVGFSGDGRRPPGSKVGVP
jgi:SAM-dependent methyltransferase